MVDLPDPEGAEKMINFPSIVYSDIQISCLNFTLLAYTVLKQRTGYITLSTCSLICSSSSFIWTTIFCISAWFDLLPNVLISLPIS